MEKIDRESSTNTTKSRQNISIIGEIKEQCTTKSITFKLDCATRRKIERVTKGEIVPTANTIEVEDCEERDRARRVAMRKLGSWKGELEHLGRPLRYF